LVRKSFDLLKANHIRIFLRQIIGQAFLSDGTDPVYVPTDELHDQGDKELRVQRQVLKSSPGESLDNPPAPTTL
jgi:hypothetical protein